MSEAQSPFVERCEKLMAHAWMVRTFIKHCEEVEDFTELMHVARSIFDLGRALEPRIDDPAAYLKMLRKKLPKLRQAIEQFAVDAPQASTHMNFIMAVASIQAVYEDLQVAAEEESQRVDSIKTQASGTTES